MANCARGAAGVGVGSFGLGQVLAGNTVAVPCVLVVATGVVAAVGLVLQFPLLARAVVGAVVVALVVGCQAQATHSCLTLDMERHDPF